MRSRSSAFSAALLFAAVIGILAGCGGDSTTAPGPSPQWAQFRLNQRHNATLPGTLLANWRLQTHGRFSSSPAIVGWTLYIGNNSGDLYAIDVRDGRVLWKYHATSPIMSNPLPVDGMVIVGQGNGVGHDGGPQHPIVVGTLPNSIFAVDAKSGELRWRVPLPGTGMPSPAIIDNILVQHNGDGLIYGLEPETGRVRYTLDAGSAATMSAALPLDNGTFATNGGALGLANTITKRDARDGSVIWTASFPPDHWGFGDCPLAADGKLLFCNDVIAPPGAKTFFPGLPGIQDAYGVDASTGKIRWDVRYESGPMPLWNLSAIPLVYNGTLYFGSALRPVMHAVDPANGRIRWRLQVRGPVKGGIAAKDGIIYFGDLRGYLWAVDARTGKAIGWKNMRTSFNVGSPVIDGQTLFIGSNSGAVIAIPLDVIRRSRGR